MKTEYLIHEYMWSNHCISGNKLGWGITASSMPEDRAYLRELEKLAQAAVIDKTGKTEVDELVYSSVCGFVKMSSVPCESGEDKRQNKRVRIYQPKAPESNPVAYLAPGGEWAEEESVGYLQPLFLEEPEFHRKDILQEMNLMSRLPEFMQVVFWCLSGHSEGINIVAPDWKEEEFAEKAKRLMYVIHSLLPQPASPTSASAASARSRRSARVSSPWISKGSATFLPRLARGTAGPSGAYSRQHVSRKQYPARSEGYCRFSFSKGRWSA